MTFIGITGLKKSGKSTFAEFLKNELQPHVAILSFADELKKEVATATGKSIEFIAENKDKFRTILQWWGTEFRRDMCHKDYWTSRLAVRAVSEQNHGTLYVIIPDVRFQNEADLVTNTGGYMIRVYRKAVEVGDLHPSETEQLLIKVDQVILNNTDLPYLKGMARVVAAKIRTL